MVIPPPVSLRFALPKAPWTDGTLVKKRTVTTSFGTGKRESHDSSRYYARKLCSVQPCSTNLPAINEIPSNKLDRVFQHSSEDMSELPDNSVAFMVTSPPYNVGKDYDQDLSLPEYLDFQITWERDRLWVASLSTLVFSILLMVEIMNIGLVVLTWWAETLIAAWRVWCESIRKSTKIACKRFSI